MTERSVFVANIEAGEEKPAPEPGREIRLDDARLGYGSTGVLEGVNLRITEGERCLLRGPNGAGKTTLIRSLLGLQPLLAGRLRSSFRRRGYVPQAGSLDVRFPMSVEYALELSLRRGSLFRRGGGEKERIHRMLSLVGLEGRSRKLLRECSGGELQRMLIARSLLDEPDFLVMDEPFSSIDSGGKVELARLVRGLYEERGITLLLTTHDPEGVLAGFFSTNILVERGEVLRESSTQGGRE